MTAHAQTASVAGQPLEGSRAERILFGESKRVLSLGEFGLAAKHRG